MITFRCTAKLARRFSLALDQSSSGAPTSLLGDWYATIMNVGRQRWVLCLGESTNLPILVPGRKADFPGAFPRQLELVLRQIGVPAVIAKDEAERSSEWRYAKTSDRSILGSLNDMVFQAEYRLRTQPNPVLAAAELSHMPCRLRNTIFPDEQVFALLGLADLYEEKRRAERARYDQDRLIQLPPWLAS